MLKWLRTALKDAEERVAAKDRPLEGPPRLAIGLSSMPGAIRIIEGFPQPQWELIQYELEARFASAQAEAYWHWASVEWLDLLRQALGSAYHLDESPNFLLLTSKSPNDRRTLAQKAESALAKLRHHFGEAAQKKGNGKYVIVRMGDEDSYYRYLSHFYPDGEHAASGAMFLRGGYDHIVLKDERGEGRALAHELTHCVLAALPLPTWLNEGLAQLMETFIAGANSRQPVEIWDEHRRYWTKQTIGKFWTGDSFFEAGEAQKLSYSLAQIFAEILRADHSEKLPAFICNARFEDAGQKAAAAHLGMSLGVLAGTFLGAREWEPNLQQHPPTSTNPGAKQRLVYELLLAGRVVEGRKIWEEAVAQAANDAEKAQILSCVAGMAILNDDLTGFVGEALELCDRAYRLAPDDPDIPFTKVGLLVSGTRYAEAVEALGKIIVQIESNLWRGAANYYLALAELGLGHRSEAEAAFQNGCTLAPESDMRLRVDLALHGGGAETEYWMEGAEAN